MLLRMFLNLDREDPSALAIVDDSGERLTYGDLCDKAKEFSEVLFLFLLRIAMDRF